MVNELLITVRFTFRWILELVSFWSGRSGGMSGWMKDSSTRVEWPEIGFSVSRWSHWGLERWKKKTTLPLAALYRLAAWKVNTKPPLFDLTVSVALETEEISMWPTSESLSDLIRGWVQMVGLFVNVELIDHSPSMMISEGCEGGPVGLDDERWGSHVSKCIGLWGGSTSHEDQQGWTRDPPDDWIGDDR